jgi:hypothetical protein
MQPENEAAAEHDGDAAGSFPGQNPLPSIHLRWMEFSLATEQPLGSRIALRQPRQLALHADELGALGAAVLLEPVGVDQADGVVVEVVEDGLPEPFFCGRHASPGAACCLACDS